MGHCSAFYGVNLLSSSFNSEEFLCSLNSRSAEPLFIYIWCVLQPRSVGKFIPSNPIPWNGMLAYARTVYPTLICHGLINPYPAYCVLRRTSQYTLKERRSMRLLPISLGLDRGKRQCKRYHDAISGFKVGDQLLKFDETDYLHPWSSKSHLTERELESSREFRGGSGSAF